MILLAAILLVELGQPKATICVTGNQAGNGPVEIQRSIKEATGVELKIVRGKVTPPAIIIGPSQKELPPEGFTIESTNDTIYILGNGRGTEWGCYEFCERFVGVRWYWPTDLGRSVPKTDRLVVPEVSIQDAPVFRKREIWPPCSDTWKGGGTPLAPLQTFLRSGNSWPVNVRVHQPDWSKRKDLSPEVYQLRSDGTRDFTMLCYGNPKTLATYLEHPPISGNAITVSPADADIACYCTDCRKLWDANAGQYGSASKIVATFVAKLARAVPDKTIIFLPYLNYSAAPDGIEFPVNVEVQLCGMPGLAMYKEPAIFAAAQANAEKWQKLTGRKIQTWDYDCWPENRTSAVFQYPHVVQQYYRQNRDRIVGTFINGEGDHWPRQNITLYCWLKLLWNPDFDVDAAQDEFCQRMFGAAVKTMRELLRLQVDGWEKSRWPGGRLTAKAIREISYPPATVQRMQELIAKARDEVKGDELATKRVEYYVAPFAAFFAELKQPDLQPLLSKKVGENPQLDNPVWRDVPEFSFVRAYDRENKKPQFPTTVKCAWTFDGVTFLFHMTEPTPELLAMKRKGRDDSNLWWDDNIELLLDVTGKNDGEYYHFIITAAGTIADAKNGDFSWNTDQVKVTTRVGKDSWSALVFVPFAAFPEAVKPLPGSVSDLRWTGNFTRHRIGDRKQQEYSRLNTTFTIPSNNLTDFAPIKTIE